ncbi:MAG: hypothetical protein OD814_001739 [Candidatus Alkanophagales archaeon MCA70_species_1]|nr:hypothetical protein [Candidatus Alkanophaga volatiphilum]
MQSETSRSRQLLRERNQTKVGLKPASSEASFSLRTRKKSDQGGIETTFTPRWKEAFRGERNQTKVGLKLRHTPPPPSHSPRRKKSDQGGIETRERHSCNSDLQKRKKSDQGGIETKDGDAKSLAAVGKKSDQGGIETRS